MYVPPTASLKWIRFFQQQPLLCFLLLLLLFLFGEWRLQHCVSRFFKRFKYWTNSQRASLVFPGEEEKKHPHTNSGGALFFFPEYLKVLWKIAADCLNISPACWQLTSACFFCRGLGPVSPHFFFFWTISACLICFSDVLSGIDSSPPRPHPPFSSADAEAELSTIRSHSSDGFFKRLPYSAPRRPHWLIGLCRLCLAFVRYETSFFFSDTCSVSLPLSCVSSTDLPV